MLKNIIIASSLLFVSVSAFCSQPVASGRVNFTGYIYEPACTVVTDNTNVNTECYKNNKKVKTSYNVNSLTSNESSIYSLNVESISKTAKVLVVNYK